MRERNSMGLRPCSPGIYTWGQRDRQAMGVKSKRKEQVLYRGGKLGRGRGSWECIEPSVESSRTADPESRSQARGTVCVVPRYLPVP